MPVILEAADLVLIAALLVLIGLLTGTKYTFVLLANVLDVGIAGVHPFRGIANRIESTIIGGINDGINDLGGVLHDLWTALTWSIHEMVKAIDGLASDTYHAFNYLFKTSIHALIHLYTDPIWQQMARLDAYAKLVANDLANDVESLRTDITNKVAATKETVERDLSTAFLNAEHTIATGLTDLKNTLEGEIHRAETSAESAGTEAVSKLRAAENAAIDALGRVEGATTIELNDFIGKVPLTDILSVIAAVPILSALVNTIASESGLEKAECRSKVKSICTTDPSVWSNFIAGLLAYEGATNLRALIEVGGQIARGMEDTIVELGQAA